MKKGMKKLHLHRETLRNLTEDLRSAVGGVTLGPGCATKDPTVCGTNCAACDLTDTCTLCSSRCM